MASDLMLAVMSLDVYNRGPFTKLDLNDIKDKLGSYIIERQEEDRNKLNSGFFYSSYSNGSEYILSFRGTDANNPNALGIAIPFIAAFMAASASIGISDPIHVGSETFNAVMQLDAMEPWRPMVSDVLHGYGIALGNYNVLQAQYALDAYETMIGDMTQVISSDAIIASQAPYNVTITGQSMVRSFLAAACGLLLAGCSVDRPWRNYEIIVDVPTPHGVVRGSGVISARTRDYRGIEGSFAISLVKGEAIPIKLDDGRLLFMTMGRGGSMWAVLAPWVEDRNLPALASGKVVPMDKRLYPQFAMFHDIKNPKTGYRAMAEVRDGIGPGYGPVSISIRETKKRRDEKIVEMMPWVLNLPANLRGGTRCGSSTPDNDPCMNAMDFNMDGFGRGK